MPRTAQETLASDSIHPVAPKPVDRVALLPGTAFAPVRGASPVPGTPTDPYKHRTTTCHKCPQASEIEAVHCDGARVGYCGRHFALRAQAHAKCPRCWKQKVDA